MCLSRIRQVYAGDVMERASREMIVLWIWWIGAMTKQAVEGTEEDAREGGGCCAEVKGLQRAGSR